jgi:hypothetical protein
MSSNPVASITNTISDVLGTSGGGGGLLGAVESVGQEIGNAGEVIDKNVLQPALQDPVGTVVKIAAIAAAPATGGTSLYAIPAYTATKAVAAGLPIEDVAFMTAVSAAATAAGVEVGDYIGTMAEFGTELGSQQTAMLAAQNAGIGTGSAVSTAAGQIAGGATSGAIGAAATGRDPVTGLLTGATNAAIGQGVNYGVDAVGNLFTPSTVPTNVVASNTSGTTSDVGVDPTYQAWQNAINSGAIIPNRPLTQAELQAAGITTGNTSMDENFYDIFGNNADAGLAFVNPPLNLGDVEAQDGGFYGGAAPANPYENMSDTQLAAVIASRDGTDTNTALNIVKQLGTQAVKSLLGGASRPAGQGGATGTTGLGGLLGGGVNAYLSAQQRQAIQNAYSQQAQQVGLAANRAAQQATFKPIGITTAFGQSQFQVDPTTGQLTSVGYTATPEIAAQRQRLFSLGAEALPTTADTQALQQQYIAQQQGLLAPSREQQLAQLRNRQFQRGTGGLATGGTVSGYSPGAAGLMQTNPEMAAYYNALERENAILAANAPTYAQDLLNKRIASGTNLFTQAGNLESMAQQPLSLASDFAKAQAAAGASAGQLGLAGQTNAARLGAEGSLLGTASMQGTYNQLGQLATGVGNQIGGMLLQNPSIANWLS